jgi:hypothetical protein
VPENTTSSATTHTNPFTRSGSDTLVKLKNMASLSLILEVSGGSPVIYLMERLLNVVANDHIHLDNSSVSLSLEASSPRQPQRKSFSSPETMLCMNIRNKKTTECQKALELMGVLSQP